MRSEAGDALSADNLAYAESFLDDPDPPIRTYASTIVLRCSDSESVKAKAVETVEELCRQAADEDFVCRLLIALMFVPLHALSTRSALRYFVARATRSSRFQIRLNAAWPLGRLAKSGDAQAIGLLGLLAKDSDEQVRKNAKVTLAQLGRQP